MRPQFPITLISLLISLILSVTAEDAVSRWSNLAAKSSTNVIRLDDTNFDEFITTERNYTVIVALTALAPVYQCALCREFDPAFSTVALSWRKAHPHSDNVFFAKLDFANGRPIFVRFGLQSAPNVWIYPPTSGPLSKLSPSPNQPLIYDFPGNGMQVQPFHKFLISNAKLPPFPIVRPFDWTKLFFTIFIIFAAGIVLKFAWPEVKKIITNKNAWAAASLVTILLFTSGHMFNTIRHTPYTQSNGRGGFNYIAGGFQNQFGIETQIVAAIYGILAFTTIALVLKAPTIRDPTAQSIVIWIWSAGIMLVYSYLIFVFRFKNGGYPFKLFL